LRLDHLVYVVPDLDEAIETFASRLGVAPVVGGRHASIGTWNAILPLDAGCYLELMAVDPANLDPPSALPFGLAKLVAPGLVSWAAATSDIEEAVAAARDRGFDPGAIVDLARETPAAERLTWRLTIGRDLPGDGLAPFLIEWGSTPHPSGVSVSGCRLKAFRCVHPDPAKLRSLLALLGDSLAASLRIEHGVDPGLHASLVGPAGEMALGPAIVG
jgi:hypothetical protein